MLIDYGARLPMSRTVSSAREVALGASGGTGEKCPHPFLRWEPLLDFRAILFVKGKAGSSSTYIHIPNINHFCSKENKIEEEPCALFYLHYNPGRQVILGNMMSSTVTSDLHDWVRI